MNHKMKDFGSNVNVLYYNLQSRKFHTQKMNFLKYQSSEQFKMSENKDIVVAGLIGKINGGQWKQWDLLFEQRVEAFEEGKEFPDPQTAMRKVYDMRDKQFAEWKARQKKEEK